MKYHSRHLCAALCLLSCFLIVIAASRRPAFASGDGRKEHGAEVFHTKGCEQCHSITGVGGDRAPDLGSVGLRRTPARIEVQVLKGGHGMPPFEKVLSKGEVKDLVIFLAACRTDVAPGCRQWLPPQ